MEYIGGGKEGDVYVLPEDKKKVMKIYKPHVNQQKRRREFDFLSTFRRTGNVPLLYSNHDDLKGKNGFLIMENLSGYMTLHSWKKNKKAYSDQQKNRLIQSIATARKTIGKNIKYGDLTNLNNIMVRFENDDIHIKFLDPGSVEIWKNDYAWRDFMKDLLYNLNLTRMKAAKEFL